MFYPKQGEERHTPHEGRLVSDQQPAQVSAKIRAVSTAFRVSQWLHEHALCRGDRQWTSLINVRKLRLTNTAAAVSRTDSGLLAKVSFCNSNS